MLTPIYLPDTQEFMHRDYSKTGSGICFLTRTEEQPVFGPAKDRGITWDGDVITELRGDFWFSKKPTPMFKVKEDGRDVLIKIEWGSAGSDTLGGTVILNTANSLYTYRNRRYAQNENSGFTYLVYPYDWHFTPLSEIPTKCESGSKSRAARLAEGKGRIFL